MNSGRSVQTRPIPNPAPPSQRRGRVVTGVPSEPGVGSLGWPEGTAPLLLRVSRERVLLEDAPIARTPLSLSC
jgi:hypothetical protein